jgi:hypothetical protein
MSILSLVVDHGFDERVLLAVSVCAMLCNMLVRQRAMS